MRSILLYIILLCSLAIPVYGADASFAHRTFPDDNIEKTYGTASRDYSVLANWEAYSDYSLASADEGHTLIVHKDQAEYDDRIEIGGASTEINHYRGITGFDPDNKPTFHYDNDDWYNTLEMDGSTEFYNFFYDIFCWLTFIRLNNSDVVISYNFSSCKGQTKRLCLVINTNNTIDFENIKGLLCEVDDNISIIRITIVWG